MPRRYVLFAQLPYAYTVMRPLQDEIRRRDDQCAWYLDNGCADLLRPDEERLLTVADVKAYQPLAVFTPGNCHRASHDAPCAADGRCAPT